MASAWRFSAAPGGSNVFEVPKNPIRALRESQGVTADDFAAMAGMSRSTLTTLEAGRYASIPESWASAIMTLGASYPDMCDAYKLWRSQRQLAAYDAYASRQLAN
jgi:DNA-binding XRE family transcriptional regulator